MAKIRIAAAGQTVLQSELAMQIAKVLAGTAENVIPLGTARRA